MAKEHGRGVQYSNFERQLRMNIRMNLPSLLSHCCLNMCNAYIYILLTIFKWNPTESPWACARGWRRV